MIIFIFLVIVCIVLFVKNKKCNADITLYKRREIDYQKALSTPPSERDCKIWYYRNLMDKAVRKYMSEFGHIKTWKWLDGNTAFLCDNWEGQIRILTTYMDNAQLIGVFSVNENNVVLVKTNATTIPEKNNPQDPQEEKSSLFCEGFIKQAKDAAERTLNTGERVEVEVPQEVNKEVISAIAEYISELGINMFQYEGHICFSL